jgi:LAO/AO transport system ATPase
MRGNDTATKDIEQSAKAIRAGDRVALARAITLVESAKPEDQANAQALLDRLLPHAGNAIRVGVSGVPGAGKSTLIDQLGLNLVAKGHKVAVLAVDPTSSRTGGSILGDKTRMARLAVHPDAYIRPSPTSGTLGGVTKATRETIVLLEAAGFDVILVETVGVGQSEVAVANMVDTFVFLTLARTGDQLQGIKKGVLELADIVVVNKADGEHATEANAFIRPSPAGDSLGGVTKATRETIALAEAAGYDVVLVETVGVGQSETAVANMVDVFVVVAIPGAGDELQGIKRGLLELADIIAVNKADGDRVEPANRAAMEYRTALHILAAGHTNWDPQVLTLSARDNKDLDALWTRIEQRHEALLASGALRQRRSDQAAAWMREIFEQRLLAAFKGSRHAARHFQELEDKVRAGEMTPAAAAHELGRLAGIKDAD